MKNKILKILDSTAGRLVFALLCGTAYYLLSVRFIISWSKGSLLIAGYAAPLIICGAAIIIINMMKQCKENGNDSAIFKLFVLHAVLFTISVVSLNLTIP